jgi:hypothetical protein
VSSLSRMADTISCPKCSAEIPLSDAVTHSLREQFTRDFSEKQRELERSVAEKQKELETQRKALAQAQQDLDAQVAQKLGLERKKLSEQAQQQARDQFAVEMQDLKTQLADRAKKLEEAQRHELALRTQQREVEERAKNLELEITRKLDTERAKLQEDARKQATDEQLMRLADKDKLINDLKTQIESLKQKAEQGSQQSQGEVMELQLEDLLKQAFPLDEFLPVPQGARGADLLQHVHNPLGQKCGIIIWESKRTKHWQQPWLTKLKDDARAQGADLAILVSQALPDGVAHAAHVEGVWVCNFTTVLLIASALRGGLLQVAAARRAESGKGEKMEVLYQFVTSPQFRLQVEGVLEAFVEMKRDVDNERRAMERLWKKREAQLTRVLNGISGQYGSLQGIVGSAALPEIRALELDGGEGAKEE